MEFLKMKYNPNNKLRYMPDFIGKRKRGRLKANSQFKSALEMVLAKKKGKKKRKRPLEMMDWAQTMWSLGLESVNTRLMCKRMI